MMITTSAFSFRRSSSQQPPTLVMSCCERAEIAKNGLCSELTSYLTGGVKGFIMQNRWKNGPQSIGPRVSNEQGGVILRSVIIIFTLLIVGVTIFSLLKSYSRNQETYHRRALAISEYGLMVALQKLQDDPLNPSEIPKTKYNKGWYKVFISKQLRNNTTFYTVISYGRAGSVTEKRECVLRLDSSGGEPLLIRERMQ